MAAKKTTTSTAPKAEPAKAAGGQASKVGTARRTEEGSTEEMTKQGDSLRTGEGLPEGAGAPIDNQRDLANRTEQGRAREDRGLRASDTKLEQAENRGDVERPAFAPATDAKGRKLNIDDQVIVITPQPYEGSTSNGAYARKFNPDGTVTFELISNSGKPGITVNASAGKNATGQPYWIWAEDD